jgi:ribose transport system ATP-binding protein
MTNDQQLRPGSLVSIRDLDQFYGHTQVLHGCSLDIAPGEVHALVGENGSGKSTIVKLLSGVIQPSRGVVAINGEHVALSDPAGAQAHGIVTVFQETLTSDACSVIDNVMLGTGGMFHRGMSRRAERATVESHLRSIGVPASTARQPTHLLSLADRQVLTIARALVRPWKLLILDEATSALDVEARDRLFDLIREHVASDRSVLFVSHRMDELAVIMDRATVQRSGRTVGTLAREDATTDRLLQMMSGQPQHAQQPQSPRRTPTGSDEAVRCQQVRMNHRAGPFDLSVRRGEVLGVAGLDGHGAPELLETIAGIRRPVAGNVTVSLGEACTELTGYRQARRARVAYVPGKRQDEGLFPTLNVRDNLLMATYGAIARAGVFRRRTVDGRTRTLINELNVHPSDHRLPIGALSGGNAQKVLVGRWLATSPRVLLLNDPLRGVDLTTKREFYRLLDRLSADGVTVIMYSTEIEELLHVAHRIAVCRSHSVDIVFDGEGATTDVVLAAMFGHATASGLVKMGAR